MPLFKVKKPKPDEIQSLMRLIDFCIDREIPAFSLDGFVFNLSHPNPNQDELNALKADYERTKEVVTGLALKSSFSIKRTGT